MIHRHLVTKKSPALHGEVVVSGAKNAALPILASLILTRGFSRLTNVPFSSDILNMLQLLRELGATVMSDEQKKSVTVDTSALFKSQVSSFLMNSMRASILALGPLLARFGRAAVALPGGCLIGARPINYHLQGFSKMGVKSQVDNGIIEATFDKKNLIKNNEKIRIVLDYPSVGATENLMMFAAMYPAETIIVNAALEPEVLDLIAVLTKMGAQITVGQGAFITINGVAVLQPIEHAIISDRLEAGTLLIAAAMSGGKIILKQARPDHLDTVFAKLQEMGHEIFVDEDNTITLQATQTPRAVTIKTGPYPAFPTDLQPSFMAALTLAKGVSVVEETVFENRLMHIQELQRMGAAITLSGMTATITGVEKLQAGAFTAQDIRGAGALVLAGLCAEGESAIQGLAYWQRAYDGLENKLFSLGAPIKIV